MSSMLHQSLPCSTTGAGNRPCASPTTHPLSYLHTNQLFSGRQQVGQSITQLKSLCKPLKGVKAAHPARQSRSHCDAVICAAGSDKLTIAVTGATGLVGSRLVAKLTAQGHKVKVLTRNVGAARGKLPYSRLEFHAPPQWSAAVAGTDAVINLAGEPIATRWTSQHKEEIKRSRIGVTRTLVDAINALPNQQRPKVFISTSAIGFYGVSDAQTFNETSPSGRDFLASVCRDWEAAATAAQVERVVVFRSGIVLAREGGALGRMLPVFNIFAGGPLGSGRQWCSWIHRDDLVNLQTQALTDPTFKGVYNATSPNPVRMSELCASLGAVTGRPSWLPVPDFALQTLLGEGASVVLEGQRVVPARAQREGFKFQFEHIRDALANILR